jgi:Cdc6-like AAA superfamily ATPase
MKRPNDIRNANLSAKGVELPILKTNSLFKKAFRENDTTPTLIRDIPNVCAIATENGPEVVQTEQIHVKFNSVNVFIGKKGTGKTVCALNEVSKISLTGQYHLFVYACPGGVVNDDSFETLKLLIEENLPVIKVSTDEIVNYLDKLIKYKSVYDDIKRVHDENRTDPRQRRNYLLR